jgi:hypothetical protein
MIDNWFHNVYNSISNTVRDVYNNAKNLLKSGASKVSDISTVISNVLEGVVQSNIPILKEISQGGKILFGDVGKIAGAIGGL